MPHLELRLPLLHPLYLCCQPRRLPLQLLQDLPRLLVALPLLPQLPLVALLLVADRRLLLLLLAKRVLQGLQVREGGETQGRKQWRRVKPAGSSTR